MSQAHLDAHAEALHFQVNLADAWERQYLARRLGISEEALVASSSHIDPSVEEIFDHFCPAPRAHGTHAQLHVASVAEQAALND